MGNLWLPLTDAHSDSWILQRYG